MTIYPAEPKKPNLNRIVVNRYETIVSDLNIDGIILSDIKKNIDNWIDKYGSDAILEFDDVYDRCGDIDRTDLVISYISLETDEEMNERIHNEEMLYERAKLHYVKEMKRINDDKIRNEENEKQLYERLKKKYG